MMTALLQDDSWHFKAEVSVKGSDCVHMYRKRTGILHFKKIEMWKKKVLKYYTAQQGALKCNSKVPRSDL